LLASQFPLDPAPVGFYASATLIVLFGLVLVYTDIPGAQRLDVFQSHDRSCLP
jgi:hypothetical protein